MSNKQACALVAAVVLAGCQSSVVRSVPLAANNWIDEGYLTYGVGQSILTVEIGGEKAKPAPAEAPAGEPADDAGGEEEKFAAAAGATSAPKIDPKAKAADTKPKAAAAKTTPAKKADEPAADACTQLRVAYAKIVDKHALFSLALGKFRETATPLSLKQAFTPDEQKAALAAVAEIDAAFAADVSAMQSAKDIFAVAQQVCPPPVVTITHSAAAAPGRQYVLKCNPDFFAADKVDFKVGPDGLLTSASVTAKDTTGDAILGGATSIGTFMVPFPADVFGAGSLVQGAEETKAVTCKTIGFRFEQIARDLTKLPKCVSPEWLGKMLERSPAIVDLPALTPKPVKRRYVLNELAGKKIAFETFDVAASCTDALPGEGPASDQTISQEQKDAAVKTLDGLVVSSARACRVQVLDGANVMADEQFWALDPTHLLVLPLSRTRLTTRTATYAFAGGQPSKVTEDLGSPAATLFGLPGQIVGSMITGYNNTATSQKDILDAQTENLKAQALLIAAQKDLDKAKSGEAVDDGSDDE